MSGGGAILPAGPIIIIQEVCGCVCVHVHVWYV